MWWLIAQAVLIVLRWRQRKKVVRPLGKRRGSPHFILLPSRTPGKSLRKRRRTDLVGASKGKEVRANTATYYVENAGYVAVNVGPIYRATVHVAQNRRPVFEGYPPGRRFGKVGGALRERNGAGVRWWWWWWLVGNLVRAFIFKVSASCVFAFFHFLSSAFPSSTLTHSPFFFTLAESEGTIPTSRIRDMQRQLGPTRCGR